MKKFFIIFILISSLFSQLGFANTGNSLTENSNNNFPQNFRRIQYLAINPFDPMQLLAASGNTLFKTDDKGNHWRQISVKDLNSRIAQIVYHPSIPNVIFLTTDKNEIFKSLNDGETWQSLENRIPEYCWHPYPYADKNLIFSPVKGSDTIYFTASNCLLKSKNGGNSWEDYLYNFWGKFVINSFNPQHQIIIKLDTYTDDEDSYFMALFNRFNDGQNWNFQYPIKMSFNDTNLRIRSFKDLTFISPSKIVARVEDKISYEEIDNNNVQSILIESNDLANWRCVKFDGKCPGKMTPVTTYAVNPQNPEEIYAGVKNLGLFKTVNGGGYWRNIDPSFSNKIITGIVVNPLQGSEVYLATKASGIYRSINGGKNFVNKSAGLGRS